MAILNVKFAFNDNFLSILFGSNYHLPYICIIKLKSNDNLKIYDYGSRI